MSRSSLSSTDRTSCSSDGHVFWWRYDPSPSRAGSVQTRTFGTPSTVMRQLGAVPSHAQQPAGPVVLEAAAVDAHAGRVQRRRYRVPPVRRDPAVWPNVKCSTDDRSISSEGTAVGPAAGGGVAAICVLSAGLLGPRGRADAVGDGVPDRYEPSPAAVGVVPPLPLVASYVAFEVRVRRPLRLWRVRLGARRDPRRQSGTRSPRAHRSWDTSAGKTLLRSYSPGSQSAPRASSKHAALVRTTNHPDPIVTGITVQTARTSSGSGRLSHSVTCLWYSLSILPL